MPSVDIIVGTPIERTPRVQQLEGLFDIPIEERSAHSWKMEIPLEDRQWHIGLITGPSGSGKSTITKNLFPEELRFSSNNWFNEAKPVVDSFPVEMGIKEITNILSSVGFSSPPDWLKPFNVLSTGQQFRVRMALTIASPHPLAVLDEFTSTVDRTVAQIGSHAIARTIRSRNQKFVAVTCHEDIIEWLNPDWILRADTQSFAWRLLQRRPAITLEISRVYPEAWDLFSKHHYLSTNLVTGAKCFVALWNGRPVAFSAWIPHLSNRPSRREHRTVTLPDFQGVGIGHALSTFIASCWKAMGIQASSTTSHPAFIQKRKRDPNWIMTRAPAISKNAWNPGEKKRQHAYNRLTAGFRYVGEPASLAEALALMGKSNEAL